MEVSCTFLEQAGGLTRIDMRPVTSLGGTTSALRDRCLDIAVNYKCPMWAMPDVGKGDDSWLVYERRYSDFAARKRFPNRAAAEMWMVHHGNK